MPEALRLPIEDDNLRRVTNAILLQDIGKTADSITNLRDEAITLYKAYNDQSGAPETTR
jgi:hypothetical protein